MLTIRALLCVSASFLVCLLAPCRAAEPPRFEAVVLDPEVGKVCYAVTVADVDGDQKTDVVAVTENRVVWFQNPDWKLRVVIQDQTERDNVCIASHDIDGDGQIDFALGAGWTKAGVLHWLSRGKSLDERWNVHLIGKEGWLHRVRFGDILGSGQPQLVISPLNKTVSETGVRLTAFEIPKDPKSGAWKGTVLDELQNGMHNHWMGDLDGDGRTDLITAAREGVFLFRRNAEGRVDKTMLGRGVGEAEKPEGFGAGEIKVGWLAPKRPFLVTVEPMHGQNISVYTSPQELLSGPWTRHVIETKLTRGHALATGDLNGDGRDEIVMGHSDKGTGDPAGPGVFVFTADDADGAKWTKSVVDDGGIATEDLAVADFNGDGRLDIVAGGRATHNVKLYWNRTK